MADGFTQLFSNFILSDSSSQLDYDIVGSSYANALVEVAQQKNCLEAVHADIDALASVMKDSEVSLIYSIYRAFPFLYCLILERCLHFRAYSLNGLLITIQ